MRGRTYILAKLWKHKKYYQSELEKQGLSNDDSKLSFLIALFNPIALIKVKIVYNFGLSECNRIKYMIRPHVGPVLAGRFSCRVTIYILMKN